MMINGPRETYLFDRDNSVFSAPGLTFPQRKNLNDHITDTLLDGVRFTIAVWLFTSFFLMISI